MAAGGAPTEHPSDGTLLSDVEGLQYTDSELFDAVEASVATLERAIELWPTSATACAGPAPSPNDAELVLAFNGGKDATVCLNLMRIALARRRRMQLRDAAAAADDRARGSGASTDGTEGAGGVASLEGAAGDGKGGREAAVGLRAVYFRAADDFPELLGFVADAVAQLGLSFVVLPEVRTGLQRLSTLSGARAIVMGTRRGDPHGATMSSFEPTTRGWPAMLRVNPVIDWSYSMVWRFLRGLRLPYCKLYDEGYTSLGAASETVPNPQLSARLGAGGGDSGPAYAPAYALGDEGLERVGRADGPERSEATRLRSSSAASLDTATRRLEELSEPLGGAWAALLLVGVGREAEPAGRAVLGAAGVECRCVLATAEGDAAAAVSLLAPRTPLILLLSHTRTGLLSGGDEAAALSAERGGSSVVTRAHGATVLALTAADGSVQRVEALQRCLAAAMATCEDA